MESKTLITTKEKLINRLIALATKYEKDLVREELVCENFSATAATGGEQEYIFMFQHGDSFKTVLGVNLHFYEGNRFDASVGSEFSILPTEDRVDFEKIHVVQGDRIDELLDLIDTALQAYEDAT